MEAFLHKLEVVTFYSMRRKANRPPFDDQVMQETSHSSARATLDPKCSRLARHDVTAHRDVSNVEVLIIIAKFTAKTNGVEDLLTVRLRATRVGFWSVTVFVLDVYVDRGSDGIKVACMCLGHPLARAMLGRSRLSCGRFDTESRQNLTTASRGVVDGNDIALIVHSDASMHIDEINTGF